jgi:hypothetical protein
MTAPVVTARGLELNALALAAREATGEAREVAWAALVEAAHGLLVKSVRMHRGPANPDQMEERLQVARLAMVRALRRWRPEAGAFSNTLRRWVRRDLRRARLLEHSFRIPREAWEGGIRPPDVLSLQGGAAERGIDPPAREPTEPTEPPGIPPEVTAALGRLTPIQREAIVARYGLAGDGQERRGAALCDLLGVGRHVADKRVRDGIERLRATLRAREGVA